MPVNPSAALQASISGGANQAGGITAALSATVQLVPVSSVGWTSQRYEIYSYPVGFATPAGWTLDGTTGAIYYATSSTPPIFTVTPWGKYLFRLTVNGGLDGNGVASPALLDESCAVDVRSPNGLHDLAWNETSQFSLSEKWVAHQKANLRVLESGLLSFPTLSSLQAYSVSGLPDGSVFVVTELYRSMRLTLVTSSATADNVLVFASSTAGRVLFRDTTYGTTGAASVTTYYISGPDATTPGNDANAGLTLASALASIDEWNIRCAGQRIGVNVTIWLSGSVSTNYYSQRVSADLGEVSLTFKGIRSYTGAVTGSATCTAWDNATKTIGKMVLASGNWSALVDKPIEFSGISNAIGWVTDEIVSGTAITPGPFDTSTRASVSGSGSQAWRSYTQASIGRLAVEPTGRGHVEFVDINILSPDAGADCSVVFTGCTIYSPYKGTNVEYNGCHFSGIFSLGPVTRINSCSMRTGAINQGLYESSVSPTRVILIGQNLFRCSSSTWGFELLLGSSLVIGDDTTNLVSGALAIYGALWGLRGSGRVQVTSVGYLWGVDLPVSGVLVRVPNGVLWTYSVAAQIGTSDLIGTSPAAKYAVGANSPTTSTTLPALGGTGGVYGFARDSGSGS